MINLYAWLLAFLYVTILTNVNRWLLNNLSNRNLNETKIIRQQEIENASRMQE